MARGRAPYLSRFPGSGGAGRPRRVLHPGRKGTTGLFPGRAGRAFVLLPRRPPRRLSSQAGGAFPQPPAPISRRGLGAPWTRGPGRRDRRWSGRAPGPRSRPRARPPLPPPRVRAPRPQGPPSPAPAFQTLPPGSSAVASRIRAPSSASAGRSPAEALVLRGTPASAALPARVRASMRGARPFVGFRGTPAGPPRTSLAPDTARRAGDWPLGMPRGVCAWE